MVASDVQTARQAARVTASGIGRIAGSSELELPPNQLREFILDSTFAVFEGVELDDDGLRHIASKLGQLVRYRDESAAVGYGYGDILKLDADPGGGKVITGSGMLPLHTDGVLLGTMVDFSLLYCVSHSGSEASGSTLVCDQVAAWRDLPNRLGDELRRRGLEYNAQETGYFPTVAGKHWYGIPLTRTFERGPALNIAFPFESGSPAAWEVRVAGLNDEDSEALLSETSEFFCRDTYTYRHHWKAGDLLVFDNRYTLHGRSAIQGGDRQLLRAQVVMNAD